MTVLRVEAVVKIHPRIGVVNAENEADPGESAIRLRALPTDALECGPSFRCGRVCRMARS